MVKRSEGKMRQITLTGPIGPRYDREADERDGADKCSRKKYCEARLQPIGCRGRTHKVLPG